MGREASFAAIVALVWWLSFRYFAGFRIRIRIQVGLWIRMLLVVVVVGGGGGTDQACLYLVEPWLRR
jgi:hypothetical protein